MDQSKVDDLEHLLTENALAFLRRSVEGMKGNPDARDADFAIVDLAVGVEVLLKARLLRHDWKLICSKGDKTPEAQLETEVLAGTAHTISPSRAEKLLETEVGVDFKAHGYDGRVEQVSKLRNRAVHFTLSQGPLPISVKVAYGSGLDFVLWFVGSEFRDSGGGQAEDLVEEFIEELTEVVSEIKDFVAEREKSIEGFIISADACLVCPRCEKPAVTFTEHEAVRCAFCLWKPIDGGTGAEEYVVDVLGMDHYTTVTSGGEWRVHECVQCGEWGLVAGVEEAGEHPSSRASALQCDGPVRPHWACFGCGMTAGYNEIERCNQCDRATVHGGDDGAPICTECWGKIAESN